MKRYHITLGASTTAGGKVISASSRSTIDGVSIALEGDLIACKVCKSTGHILCIGPRIPEIWNGKQVALEDDLCICACTPAPRLKPAQGVRYQTLANLGLDDTEEIMEQYFAILDENGKPIDGYHYDLYQDDTLHTNAASFTEGKTVVIEGEIELRLVIWLKQDGVNG